MKRIATLSLALCLFSALFVVVGASATSQPATRSGVFPVTVVSANGPVLIRHRPTRILSLSASATQMFYAIGAGPQVVGVDKYSMWPPNAPRTNFTGYESSAEEYLRERPDLVILATDTSHVVEQLKKLHIATLLLPPATTIAGANAQVRELGLATGHVRASAIEVASINSYLTSISHQVGTRAKGKSYYVEIDPTLYSATSKTFIGALFSKLGMVNIADRATNASSGYPQLTAEYLIQADPQYVFLADTTCCQQNVATFAQRPGYSTMVAVRNHEVIGLNDGIAQEWGPHSLEVFFNIIAKSVTR